MFVALYCITFLDNWIKKLRSLENYPQQRSFIWQKCDSGIINHNIMVFVDNLLFENHMTDSTVLGEGHFEYMEINIF